MLQSDKVDRPISFALVPAGQATGWDVPEGQ